MRLYRTVMAFCVLGMATSGVTQAARQDQPAGTSPAGTSPYGRGVAVAERNPQLASLGLPRSNAGEARRPALDGQAYGRQDAGISCVPYARAVSGIQVTGNGGDWWGNAATRYDRGQRPEAGAVMAFRAKPGMPLGHVAVVRRVTGPRSVQIDHANWAPPGTRRGRVKQDVSVMDVSDRNDWTAVRVQVEGHAEVFGQVYPTYGFIYNRPIDSARGGTSFARAPLTRGLYLEQVAELPAAAGWRRFDAQGFAPLPTNAASPRR